MTPGPGPAAAAVAAADHRRRTTGLRGTPRGPVREASVWQRSLGKARQTPPTTPGRSNLPQSRFAPRRRGAAFLWRGRSSDARDDPAHALGDVAAAVAPVHHGCPPFTSGGMGPRFLGPSDRGPGIVALGRDGPRGERSAARRKVAPEPGRPGTWGDDQQVQVIPFSWPRHCVKPAEYPQKYPDPRIEVTIRPSSSQFAGSGPGVDSIERRRGAC
jgi:hypothetical protein